jgi:predicted outer membrane lipoprotein
MVLLARANASSPVRGMAAALKLPAFWVSAVAGGLAFWATMVVQPPIQIGFGRWVARIIAMNTFGEVVSGSGSVLISGIVQEALKLFAILAGILLMRSLSYAPFLGTVAGCSFGIVEAIWLVVLPTLRAGQALASLGVIERIFAIAFHAASATVLGVGLAKRRGAIAYVLAAFLHGLLNFGVVLKALWILNVVQLEVWVAVGSLVTLAIARRWLSTLRTNIPLT